MIDLVVHSSVSPLLSAEAEVVRRPQLQSVYSAWAWACAFAAAVGAYVAAAVAAVVCVVVSVAAAVLALLPDLDSSCQAYTDPACQADLAAEHTETALAAAVLVESQAFLDILAAWLSEEEKVATRSG